MRKALLIILVAFLVLQHGYRYIYSEKFQAYGDETKKPWTCQVNMLLAETKIITSDYPQAIYLMEKVLNRCPKSKWVKKAEYKLAVCTEKDGRWRDAVEMYRAFAKKYPDTESSKRALRRAGTLYSQLSQ